MKKLISILLMMVMVFTFIGCETANNNAEVVNVESNDTVANDTVANDTAAEETTEEVATYYPLTFTDGMGREVTIESEPMTVISTAPSMTETLFALGLGDRVVGRTDYCNFPEAALEVESIGSLREPNIEAIIALNPDLILMSTHASEEVLAKFEEAGLNTAILTAQESFDGVYEIINQAGFIFNVVDNATTLTDAMKVDVQTVVDAIATVEKKSVYYVVGFGEYGEYTATGDTFIHDMLELAGGTNIAADGEGWSYNLETIIEKDPEVLICSELNETKASLEGTEGYMELTAVKEGRLLEINQDLLSRQGPRLAKGLMAIAKLLHPEAF